MIIFENSVPIELDDNDPRALAIIELHELTIQQASQQQADDVRQDRNALLAASDWAMAADATTDKAAWATYRQALRDVPQQAGFPSSVVWPVKP